MDGPVCGIDVGTTSVKAVVVAPDGELLGEAESDPIDTDTSAPGSSEQVPASILAAVQHAAAAAVAEGTAGVAAAAMAAQSGSVIPLAGGTATRAITWMDARSAPMVAALPADVRHAIRATSGWSPSPGLGLSTIAWLRETGQAEGVDRWASVDDYVLHELTGRWTTNPSNAAGMQLMDAARLEWSDALCALAGVDAAQLSVIAPSGSVAGSLTPEAATAMDVPQGIPVVVGGHDQACAALGLGVVEPGDVMMSTGTAWVVTVVVERAVEPAEPFSLSPHVLDGRSTASANLGGLGAVLAWALDSFGPAPVDIAEHPPDRNACFFVPALGAGSRAAWGEFVGEPSGPLDRLRAVFEACGHETRLVLDALAPIVPAQASSGRLEVVGGGGRGSGLMQMLADATGRDLAVSAEISWPAVGAAKLAAAGVGGELADPGWRTSTMIACRPETAELYRGRRREYRRLTAGD